ncbi:MAG: hypothetical protein ACJ786_39865 [Catenulispora sp.]
MNVPTDTADADAAVPDPWIADVAGITGRATVAVLVYTTVWTALVVLTGGACLPVSFLAGSAIALWLSFPSAHRRWFPALAALLALLTVGIGDLAGACLIAHWCFGIGFTDAAADLLDTGFGRHLLLTAGVLPAVVAAAVAAADTWSRLSASLRIRAYFHYSDAVCPTHAPLRPRRSQASARTDSTIGTPR